ncbi:AraC family transcriptional regulator [Paenibacillus sp. 1P07SE]|uniref:helix-turn-helix transcriptional regulator n=1 Tax=Paenibacillus sp. 1P07SE TaxID=3132209 RepID=UPI0039A52BAD
MKLVLDQQGTFHYDRKQDFAFHRMQQQHAHQGLELYYIHSGQAHVLLGTQRYVVRPNTLLFFQPFQLHCIETNHRISPLDIYDRHILVLDPHFIDPYLKSYPGLHRLFQWMWKGRVASPVLELAEDRSIGELFLELHQTMPILSAEEKQEEVVLFLTRLLHLLRRRNGGFASHTPARRATTHVEEMMSWLDSRFNEPFHLERLADHLFLTPTYISALFRQQTGMTLLEYLMSRRMREACVLLKTTALPVKQIAPMVGLQSVSYFCQLFRRELGMTPARYRKASLETLHQERAR